MNIHGSAARFPRIFRKRCKHIPLAERSFTVMHLRVNEHNNAHRHAGKRHPCRLVSTLLTWELGFKHVILQVRGCSCICGRTESFSCMCGLREVISCILGRRERTSAVRKEREHVLVAHEPKAPEYAFLISWMNKSLSGFQPVAHNW